MNYRSLFQTQLIVKVGKYPLNLEERDRERTD